MAQMTVYTSDRIPAGVESRLCTDIRGFGVHGSETRDAILVMTVDVTAPDSFSDQVWEDIKGCALAAGSIGIAAAMVTLPVVIPMIALGNYAGAAATFGEAFLKMFYPAFIACLTLKLGADLSNLVTADPKANITHTNWTNH